MGFGFKKLAKKAAGRGIELGLNTATGGIGGMLAGSVLSGLAKDDRIAKVKHALVASTDLGKLAAFAEIADDVMELGQLVKEARADGVLDKDEIEAICEEVEELATNVKKAMEVIV